MIIHQPHDKVFKKSMENSRVAHDFFESYLPIHLLERVDLTTLNLEPKFGS